MDNSTHQDLAQCCLRETKYLDQSTRIRITINRCLDEENKSFQAKLEKQLHGAWKTIAAYEVEPDNAVRSLNKCTGSSLTFRLNISVPIIRKMAITDFTRNWEKYSAHYDRACPESS